MSDKRLVTDAERDEARHLAERALATYPEDEGASYELACLDTIDALRDALAMVLPLVDVSAFDSELRERFVQRADAILAHLRGDV